MKVDIGTPPSRFRGWTTVELRFHDFPANLSMIRGAYVESEFSCLGRHWKLQIYPSGEENSRDGMVGVHLYNMSDATFTIYVGYTFKNADGLGVLPTSSSLSSFKGRTDDSGRGRDAFPNFVKKSTVFNSLVDKTLILEVRMRSYDDNNTSPFIPAPSRYVQ